MTDTNRTRSTTDEQQPQQTPERPEIDRSRQDKYSDPNRTDSDTGTGTGDSGSTPNRGRSTEETNDL